jgi:hypothetical protein
MNGDTVHDLIWTTGITGIRKPVCLLPRGER